MNFIGARSCRARPKVETIIGFMNITAVIRLASVGAPLPSLLHGPIKTSEAIVADFIAQREWGGGGGS